MVSPRHFPIILVHLFSRPSPRGENVNDDSIRLFSQPYEREKNDCPFVQNRHQMTNIIRLHQRPIKEMRCSGTNVSFRFISNGIIQHALDHRPWFENQWEETIWHSSMSTINHEVDLTIDIRKRRTRMLLHEFCDENPWELIFRFSSMALNDKRTSYSDRGRTTQMVFGLSKRLCCFAWFG